MSDLFPNAPPAVSIDDQITCVKREIGYRQHVYGRQVAAKKMTQALADKQIALMQAVLATLEKVKG